MTELSERSVFEFETEVGAYYLTASQYSDIFEHSLSSVSESGSLYGYAVENAFELVDYYRRECLSFDIFSYNEQFESAL